MYMTQILYIQDLCRIRNEKLKILKLIKACLHPIWKPYIFLCIFWKSKNEYEIAFIGLIKNLFFCVR